MKRSRFAFLAGCLGLMLYAWPVVAMAQARITEATLGAGATKDHAIVGPTTEFFPDTAKIYCTWVLKGVTGDTAVGGTWIAEDVGKVAPPNYKIDATSINMPANGKGTFGLSKPNNGFPVGRYRLEISLNKVLVKTVRFEVKAK